MSGLGRPAREHVHRDSLPDERLGELAHVPCQAALDHGRVLPGEEQHAILAHPSTLSPPASRRPARDASPDCAPAGVAHTPISSSSSRRRAALEAHTSCSVAPSTPSRSSRLTASSIASRSISAPSASQLDRQLRAGPHPLVVVAQQLQDDRPFERRVARGARPFRFSVHCSQSLRAGLLRLKSRRTTVFQSAEDTGSLERFSVTDRRRPASGRRWRALRARDGTRISIRPSHGAGCRAL